MQTSMFSPFSHSVNVWLMCGFQVTFLSTSAPRYLGSFYIFMLSLIRIIESGNISIRLVETVVVDFSQEMLNPKDVVHLYISYKFPTFLNTGYDLQLK